MIVYLLVVLLLAGTVAVRALRPVSPAELERWLQAHGLDVSAEGRAAVARYLCRSRRWRAAGFLLPFLVGSTASWAWALFYAQADPPEPWRTLANPGFWVAGYLLGAVLAELSRPRPFPAAGGRSAALLPRQPRQYLPGWVLPTCWALATGAVLAALAPRWLPVQDTVTPDRSGLVLTAAALGMTVLLQLATRAVLGRRQPYASAEQLAVDDALRSACLHRVAGAGLAFVLLVLAGRVWNLAVVVDLRPLRSALPVVTLVCLAAARAAFVGLPAKRWQVPRTPASSPTTGAGPA